MDRQLEGHTDDSKAIPYSFSCFKMSKKVHTSTGDKTSGNCNDMTVQGEKKVCSSFFFLSLSNVPCQAHEKMCTLNVAKSGYIRPLTGVVQVSKWSKGAAGAVVNV